MNKKKCDKPKAKPSSSGSAYKNSTPKPKSKGK